MSDSGRWTALGTEQYVVASATLETRFRIGVAQPLGPGGAPPRQLGDGESLPVIYVIDADGLFGLAVDTVRCLQIGELVPAALVVGIGYDSATEISDWVQLRVSHLTPTAARHPRTNTTNTGYADAFLDFISGTVKPFVEARYPADPSDATLVGDSLGGLFATHALFRQPEAFQRYLIASPALAWDNQITFRYASEYTASHSDLRARVFLSAGALETEEMLANMDRMASHLREQRYPSLSLTTKVFEDETHSSVIPATFSTGLRSVFSA